MSGGDDFEVASVAEWEEHCAHQAFIDLSGGVHPGDRFDFRAEYASEVSVAGKQVSCGCSSRGGLEACVAGFRVGESAFVEVKEIGDGFCVAVPVVFLVPSIVPPAFVATELFGPAERPVFLAHHGNDTSVITTQRAMAFESGRLVSWVLVSGALFSEHAGSFVVKGEDSRGFSAVLPFNGLYSPHSAERLLAGLRAASLSVVDEAKSRPDDLSADYFGASAYDEVYAEVMRRPGAGVAEVSRSTGLNRYLCRVLLRRLYFEGRVMPAGKGFAATAPAEPQAGQVGEPAASAEFYSAVSSGAPAGASSAQSLRSLRSLDDLAETCLKLSSSQEALSRRVDEIAARAFAVPSDRKEIEGDLTDLRLHIARLDSEISVALRRLDALDKEAQLSVASLKKHAEWAEQNSAKLSWAGAAVRDKAQKTISAYNKSLELRRAKGAPLPHQKTGAETARPGGRKAK